MRRKAGMVLLGSLVAVVAAVVAIGQPPPSPSIEKRVQALETKVATLEARKVPTEITLTNCRNLDTSGTGTIDDITYHSFCDPSEVMTGLSVKRQDTSTVSARCCKVGLK